VFLWLLFHLLLLISPNFEPMECIIIHTPCTHMNVCMYVYKCYSHMSCSMQGTNGWVNCNTVSVLINCSTLQTF
jgi:hypothetical protein